MFNLNSSSHSFRDHLRDAIAVNFERKELYAQMSANRSLRVSWPLILLEKAAIIIARWIDRKAARFQKMGIPIITNDFVPMGPLPPYDSKPLYCRQADKQILRQIARDLKNYRKSININVNKGHFLAAAKISYDFLQHIQQIEKEHHCHFAMIRHLIESIGFGVLHAPQYAKASEGATASLSQMFARIQNLGLLGCLWLDKQAGALHQMGIGILVNDLPHIPFEKEFQKTIFLNNRI